MLVNPNRCLIAALALVWATAAVAQPAPSHRAQKRVEERGVYATFGAGGAFFNDLGKRSTGSFEFRPGYAVEAALGYDFGDLRMEGEARYIAAEIDRFRMGATTLNSTGDLRAGGGMLNFYYDFENHTPYTPYVGGGAGLEYVEIDDIAVGGVGVGGRRGAVLGWQASGGFSYRINRGYGLGLGYRYTVFEGEIDTEAHRILLSVRRYFGPP